MSNRPATDKEWRYPTSNAINNKIKNNKEESASAPRKRQTGCKFEFAFSKSRKAVFGNCHQQYICEKPDNDCFSQEGGQHRIDSHFGCDNPFGSLSFLYLCEPCEMVFEKTTTKWKTEYKQRYGRCYNGFYARKYYRRKSGAKFRKGGNELYYSNSR